MSDPAIEAARRAWIDLYEREFYFDTSVEEDGVGASILAAAREALKPIRELIEQWQDASADETWELLAGLYPLIYSTEELNGE